MTDATKATDTQQVLSYPAVRGIQFVFTLTDGTKRRVTIDLINTDGRQRYCDLEGQAVRAVVAAGLQVDTFTHFLIH